MSTQGKAPLLTIETLTLIIHNAAALNPSVEAVGLVGSFARGESTHRSDVDIIVKQHSGVKFNSILNDFGEYIRHVLDYQFNKRLDIIRYDLVVNRANRTPNKDEPWFCQETFSQLLKDVKWLYER